MNRRGFLALIGTALSSPVLAHLPTSQALQFHPQAFAMAMEPIALASEASFVMFTDAEIAEMLGNRYMRPAIEALVDRDEARMVTRFKVHGLEGSL